MNRDIKALIKNMGANKTDKAITRVSRAAGGVRQIVENVDNKVSMPTTSSKHTHKSSTADEEKISIDLRQLKPFQIDPGRRHNSFPNFSSDPFIGFNDEKSDIWLARHKKNLL
jgi:hypothetical protein